MPTTPARKPVAVVKDLGELFADTDEQTRLEALRIVTTPQRLWAWAGIWSAVGSAIALGMIRLAVLWKLGV